MRANNAFHRGGGRRGFGIQSRSPPGEADRYAKGESRMRRILSMSLVSTVLVLVAQNASCDDTSKTPTGKTPTGKAQVFKAIADGNLAEVKKLALKVDLSRIAVLPYHALASPNADVVKFVRDTCELNISDLQIAAIRGDTKGIESLLGELEANARAAALAEWYAPPFSSHTPLLLAILNGHADAVRTLIAFGANLNEATVYGLTPLAKAAEGGHSDIVKQLLMAGAKINLAPDGYTALMRACTGQQPTTASILLKAGADPNLKRHDGQSALHFAAKSGNAKCVKLLLQHGADINAVAYGKSTPLAYAELYKHKHVIKLLREVKPE